MSTTDETTNEQDLPTAADDEVDAKAAETMEEDPERFPKAVYPAGPGASGHRTEPVGNETIFESDLEDEWKRGEKLAELYQHEQENRPADDPLAIAKAYRAEVDRTNELTSERQEELDEESGSSEAAGSGSYPGTHAALDELAADNGYTFTGTTIADKRAELEAAGIQPA